MRIQGNVIHREGPPLKYVFGTKNFDITRWNLQIDGYLEEYWQRFSFEALKSRKIKTFDCDTILHGLLDKGVTFWKTEDDPTGATVKLNAKNWRDSMFCQVTELTALKEKIRSPVQSAKSRVEAKLKRELLLPAVASNVPNPGFGLIPLHEEQAAAAAATGVTPVLSAPEAAIASPPPVSPSITSAETLSAPMPVGLLSGMLFLTCGERFKYIVGTHNFEAVTHWDRQIYDMAIEYWELKLKTPEEFQGQSLDEAASRFHQTLFAREVTFFRAGDGPRNPSTGELLPIWRDNWQKFDYRKIKSDNEVHRAICSLLEFTRSRVLLSVQERQIKSSDKASTTSSGAPTYELSSGTTSGSSSFKSLSLRSQELQSISLMQGDLITVNGTHSAKSMVTTSAGSIVGLNANPPQHRRRADPPVEESKHVDGKRRHGDSTPIDGSVSNFTWGSIATLREDSQLSAMSQDLSHMSVIDDMFDRKISCLVEEQRLEP